MTSSELSATQLVTDEVGGDVLLRMVDLIGAMPAKTDLGGGASKALSVPMFHQGREITVDVEVSRPHREPRIALRLLLHRGAEALTSRGVVATMALGPGEECRGRQCRGGRSVRAAPGGEPGGGLVRPDAKGPDAAEPARPRHRDEWRRPSPSRYRSPSPPCPAWLQSWATSARPNRQPRTDIPRAIRPLSRYRLPAAGTGT